jgi:hypothetical protein
MIFRPLGKRCGRCQRGRLWRLIHRRTVAAGSNAAGASYVVFGKASGFVANMNLSTLDGGNGFRLSGVDRDLAGVSVSAAGDVNGDGFDDVIIGARGKCLYSVRSELRSLWQGERFSADLNLSSLDGSNGFKLTGGGNAVAR